MSDSRKVVIIAGAGTTRSDAVDYTEDHKCPPLDKRFFSEAAEDGGYREIAEIEKYMQENYAVDILDESDSLEQVMGTIYSDAIMPFERDGVNPAEKVFFSLLNMFNKRIGSTTNHLSDENNYSRILSGYLREAVEPTNIAVITFNQDLQIEKAANFLHKNAAKNGSATVFNFPHCYKLSPRHHIDSTSPANKADVFNKGARGLGGIDILKLHGSLNWFSKHNPHKLTLRQSLLNPNRRLRITRRSNITKFTYKKKFLTLAAIVPPVGHKAGVIHTAFADIWISARHALQDADEIVVFGYSCPEQDRESENLIKGSLLKNSRVKAFSVIDPSSAVIKRYADLTDKSTQKHLHFYRDADAFLQARFSVSTQ